MRMAAVDAAEAAFAAAGGAALPRKEGPLGVYSEHLKLFGLVVVEGGLLGTLGTVANG